MSIRHYRKNKNHGGYSYFLTICVLILLQGIFSRLGLAEITLDGTLGASGPLIGPDYVISAIMGQQRGGNLFHSFSQFSITSYESASFTGPATVQNIIGRVTGGNPSRIDGGLSSDIPGANLYFINPTGVMFGPNAYLNLTGSFHVSTADYIRLGHTGRFMVTQPDESLLATDVPSAFGFLTDNPADISFQGSVLQVPEGETISLTGGNLRVEDEAFLCAPAGRINMVSVDSAGEVTDMMYGESAPFDALGEIEIAENSCIYTGGSGGGSVFIRGGRFILDQSYIYAESAGNRDGGTIDISVDRDLIITQGGEISGCTLSGGRGADIMLTAGSLELSGGGKIETSTYGPGEGGNLEIRIEDSMLISGSGSKITSMASNTGDAGAIDLDARTLAISNEGMLSGATGGEGKGADILLKVGSLELSNGGMIDTSTLAAGQGGKLMISAKDSVAVSNPDGKQNDTSLTAITSIATNTGKAGDIEISTPVLSVAHEGLISVDTLGEGEAGEIGLKVTDLTLRDGYIFASSSGVGHGGALMIEATGTISVSGTRAALSSCAFHEGDGGLVSLSSPNLVISDEGGIEAATLGKGRAGEIMLRVDSLTLKESGYITTNTHGEGDGGNLDITANSVSIFGKTGDGFGSGLFSEATDAGNAGRISLKTSILNIADNGFISASASSEGLGGNIDIKVSELQLRPEARIEAASSGAGDAGNIFIRAHDGLYCDHASMVTEAEKADGGNIHLETKNLAHLINSDVTATVKGGVGNGGNITIDSRFTVLDSSHIIAKAEGGNGGNIYIVSEAFLPTPDSMVNASSRLGIDGTVEIISPMVDVSSSLVTLPESFFNVNALLPKRCAERDEEESGSFLITGSEGLPPKPDSVLY